MIIALAFAAATCMSPEFTARHPKAVSVVVSPYFSQGTAAEREERLRNSFALMDENSDGFISDREIPIGTRGFAGRPHDEEASTALWLEGIDLNDDRKADWQEFGSYFLPVMTVASCQRG